MKTELVDIIPVQNTLGEGIIWDHRTGHVLWTDIKQAKLSRCHLESRKVNHHDLPENLCAFGLTADTGKYICGFNSGFSFYAPRDGAREEIGLVEENWSGTRMNDGRMDRSGRFWTGTMVEDEAHQPPGAGALYSTDGTSIKKHFDDVLISNGLGWSPDNKTMYFSDSPNREIYAFDFDMGKGIASNRRVFASLPEGSFPDGATVDAEGCLWVAIWGAGEVIRYSPIGEVLHKIELEASQVTCVAFAGKNLDHLCVTSARDYLSKDVLAKEPHAGDLFIFKTDVKGLPETIFKE